MRAAATISTGSSQMTPVIPSSMISGTDPRAFASTGTPLSIASIITRPNGSSHWMGKTTARARAISAALRAPATGPTSSTPCAWMRRCSSRS